TVREFLDGEKRRLFHHFEEPALEDGPRRRRRDLRGGDHGTWERGGRHGSSTPIDDDSKMVERKAVDLRSGHYCPFEPRLQQGCVDGRLPEVRTVEASLIGERQSCEVAVTEDDAAEIAARAVGFR